MYNWGTDVCLILCQCSDSQTELWRDSLQGEHVRGNSNICRGGELVSLLYLVGGQGKWVEAMLWKKALKWLNYLVRSPETWNYFLTWRTNCKSLIFLSFLILLRAVHCPALSRASLSLKPPSGPFSTFGFSICTAFWGKSPLWHLTPFPGEVLPFLRILLIINRI